MSDTTPGGWPDAARPGYPQNPEQSGYHWLCRKGAPYPAVSVFPVFWDAAEQHFQGVRPLPHEHLDYLGPCHTPAEVAALVEAARRDAFAEARDAASDATQGAVEEMSECSRIKQAVDAAIRARGDA